MNIIGIKNIVVNNDDKLHTKFHVIFKHNLSTNIAISLRIIILIN